jgi:hypothetical protein
LGHCLSWAKERVEEEAKIEPDLQHERFSCSMRSSSGKRTQGKIGHSYLQGQSESEVIMHLYHFQFPATHYSGNCVELFSVFIRHDKSPEKQHVIEALKANIKQAGSAKTEDQATEVLGLVQTMDKILTLDGNFVGCSGIVAHPKWGKTIMLLEIVQFYDVNQKKLDDDNKATLNLIRNSEGISLVHGQQLIITEPQADEVNKFSTKLDI